MAVLFRPVIPVDNSHWIPQMKRTLIHHDLRIWPDHGNKADITYMVAWKLFPGDAHEYPNLKAILSLSAGVNQYVGHPELPAHAQLIRMVEPGLSQGMREYVLSYALRFHRRHDHMKALSEELPWGNSVPALSHQRKIGVMGLGEMGMACVSALQSLGFAVNGWSRTPKDLPSVTCYAGLEGLDDFLGDSEILICLLPLTPETKGILNKDTLSKLPRGACIINAARGKHLVEDDLIPLLDSGQIDQVALDVFQEEPLPLTHPFRKHPRIHMTPHVAAITMPETGAESLKTAIEQIEQGIRPKGWVDLKRGY
jgi:glyoxylate/hydroxypyruvate reductase A